MMVLCFYITVILYSPAIIDALCENVNVCTGEFP